MTKQLPKTIFAMNRMNKLVIRTPGTTIRLIKPDGTPLANAAFTLHKTNGEQLTGNLNELGEYKITAPDSLGAVVVFDQGTAMLEEEYKDWIQGKEAQQDGETGK